MKPVPAPSLILITTWKVIGTYQTADKRAPFEINALAEQGHERARWSSPINLDTYCEPSKSCQAKAFGAILIPRRVRAASGEMELRAESGRHNRELVATRCGAYPYTNGGIEVIRRSLLSHALRR